MVLGIRIRRRSWRVVHLPTRAVLVENFKDVFMERIFLVSNLSNFFQHVFNKLVVILWAQFFIFKVIKNFCLNNLILGFFDKSFCVLEHSQASGNLLLQRFVLDTKGVPVLIHDHLQQISLLGILHLPLFFWNQSEPTYSVDLLVVCSASELAGVVLFDLILAVGFCLIGFLGANARLVFFASNPL